MPQGPKDTKPHVPLAYLGQESEVKPLNCHQQNNAVWEDNANYKSSNNKPSNTSYKDVQKKVEGGWEQGLLEFSYVWLKQQRGKKWEKNTVNVSIF